MSIPALCMEDRGGGLVQATNRGQQRASQLTSPFEATRPKILWTPNLHDTLK